MFKVNGHRLKRFYEGFQVENVAKLDLEDPIYTDWRRKYWVEPTTINKGAAWEATQREFVLFLLFIFTFIFWLFFPFLHISPYIGDNVSFKCGGGDLCCVLILYFWNKKICYLFLRFSKIFGCVCHEQDSIKLEKFITWLNKWSSSLELIGLVIFLENGSD